MKHNAFTLAEVLVTLGIIGVVAAMTLPIIIAKYQEKVLLIKVKKTYALIQTALNKYKAEKEVFDFTGLFNTTNTSDETLNNFAKYFQVIEICKSSNHTGCQGTYKVKTRTKIADGNGNTTFTGIYYLSRFVLTNGSIIGIKQYPNCYEVTETDVVDENGFATGDKKQVIRTYCALLSYDVNGKEKPNQVGKDYFCFGIKENGSIYDPKTPYCGSITLVLAEDKLNDTENYSIGIFK